ncbi:fatty acid-binding protein, liver-like [Styela clava]|uniref:fatty acid-binding protein, liver-like n=1 Tax=Styela clava TaxID=7725 RepID=UPI001939B080|nr:fatty acid-binding protein, liver-like [Styela clava]
MAFAGSYILEKRENYDEFAQASGATADQIAKGSKVFPTTEISVNGDSYTVTRKFPNQTTTNSFTLGVPTELTLVEGRKATATTTLEGGKLVTQNANFKSVTELDGSNLVETITFNGKTMKRISKKQ